MILARRAALTPAMSALATPELIRPAGAARRASTWTRVFSSAGRTAALVWRSATAAGWW
ncbi:MAG: hypothetical protein WAT25_11265 [Paracoccaceae bacterium]